MSRTLIKILFAGAGAIVLAGSAQAQDRYGRSGIPRGHLPPPGECRVWYPDRPAGHQPPPTDCRSAYRTANRYGGRVIRGSSYRDDRYARHDRYDRNGRHHRGDGYDGDRRYRDRDRHYDRDDERYYDRDHRGRWDDDDR